MQFPQEDIKRGQRLMIIKLRKYNKIRELLIENVGKGLWGYICFQHGGWKVWRTTAAVHVEKNRGWRHEQDTGAHIVGPSQE